MKTVNKALVLLILISFSATIAHCQENDFISRVKTDLFLYRTQKSDQSIVIQTDKSLYRPGETIWMKGYVTDAMTHVLSLKSLELSVLLIDNKGVLVIDGKYLLKNGIVDFNISIPSYLKSDVYYLIAYTPEMENTGIQAVFKKKIIIGRPEFLGVVPHLEFSKSMFLPEKKESAILHLMDFDGKPL